MHRLFTCIFRQRDEVGGTTKQFFKVVVCRVRTNHTQGIYPGYYPTKNFCKFCKTFIPVPVISASSACLLWLKCPGYRCSIYSPARNFCDFCTPVPQNPLTSGIFVRLSNPYPNFCKFCKHPIPLSGTSVSYVIILCTIPRVLVYVSNNTRSGRYRSGSSEF